MGRGVGLSVRGGWMMGKGQNLRSGYIFISSTQNRQNFYENPYTPADYFFDLN